MGVEGPSLAWSLLSRVLEPFYSALQLVQEAQLPFLPPPPPVLIAGTSHYYNG